jgi:NAD(P)-dependent dehydrogenase (short-subunit alcohol dehydrogenase family)
MTTTKNGERVLAGKVAVVTGASRGAGRGIARELGEAGATVYVTGRSTRGAPAEGYGRFLDAAKMKEMPGTIDDTAAEVTAAGGEGIAVRCDHREPREVEALFARVIAAHGRLDVLVNNAWGGHETFSFDSLDAPFWKQPIAHWESMFDHGVRNHIVACQAVAPHLVRQKHGLVVTTTFWDRDRYLKGNLFYDVAKAAMNRVAFAVAEEMRPHGVTSLALAPGWMRTELVLAGHDTDETHWADRPALARTESPRYLGRAVVALAGDPEVGRHSGKVRYVGELAHEYGFTDVDGRVIPPFAID